MATASDAEAPDQDVDALWAAEAERRWLEIESGDAETIPWEEVRARLTKRLR